MRKLRSPVRPRITRATRPEYAEGKSDDRKARGPRNHSSELPDRRTLLAARSSMTSAVARPAFGPTFNDSIPRMPAARQYTGHVQSSRRFASTTARAQPEDLGCFSRPGRRRPRSRRSRIRDDGPRQGAPPRFAVCKTRRDWHSRAPRFESWPPGSFVVAACCGTLASKQWLQRQIAAGVARHFTCT